MVDKGVVVLDWLVVDDKILIKMSLVMLFILDLIGVVVDMVVVC